MKGFRDSVPKPYFGKIKKIAVRMFVDVHCPDRVEPAALDDYLERGWFRMGQTIFTTNWLNFRDTFYSAIWLRVLLDDYTEDHTQKKLLQKNSRFHTEIRPSVITIEKNCSIFDTNNQFHSKRRPRFKLYCLEIPITTSSIHSK
ncbi:MAG: hypothetical protein WDO15_25805 [Bacteroidota bacterium]